MMARTMLPNNMRQPTPGQIAPVLGVLLILLTACSKRDTGLDRVLMMNRDPDMLAAVSKAQATFPQFWQVYEKREHGETNFVLMVKITDKKLIEHFSVTDFEFRDGKTMVTITNAPRFVTNVKSGDRIEIPQTNITDWSYMSNGKYVGLYTLKARFKWMPTDQLEQAKKAMADP